MNELETRKYAQEAFAIGLKRITREGQKVIPNVYAFWEEQKSLICKNEQEKEWWNEYFLFSDTKAKHDFESWQKAFEQKLSELQSQNLTPEDLTHSLFAWNEEFAEKQ